MQVHPRYLLSAVDLALVQLFDAWQGGGFAPGWLPFAGGVADQPACVMAALQIMAAADARLRPVSGGDKGDDGG